jgi:hypothetical protein
MSRHFKGFLLAAPFAAALLAAPAAAQNYGYYGKSADRETSAGGYKESDYRMGDRYAEPHATRYGNIAIVYSDGYYDTRHRWHSWRHHAMPTSYGSGRHRNQSDLEREREYRWSH